MTKWISCKYTEVPSLLGLPPTPLPQSHPFSLVFEEWWADLPASHEPPILHMALVVKNLLPSAGDVTDAASMPGWERSCGGAHGNPLQCSCLENPMDGGAWCTTESGMTKWLSTAQNIYVSATLS